MDVGRQQIARLPLNKESLRITQNSFGTTTFTNAPDGTASIQAFYAKNSYSKSTNPGITGFGFNFAGPVDLTTADQILFSYAVWFPPDFDFVLGGKLPGPYGGANEQVAKGCAGGRQDGRNLCFSLRLMWRENGDGEIYAYLPDDPANAGLLLLNGTVTDPTIYGLSVARGAFRFARGDWTVVAQRVKLNTFGKDDGELELWVNGKSVIHATNVVLRAVPETQVRGIEAETFFGGSNSSWESPKDQFAYMAAFSGATVAPGSSPAEGKRAYPLASGDRLQRSPVFSIATTCLIFAIVSLAL
ncbi:hypothetical protein EXIGLDRAFT_625522 [Exidia glandulosa HHB12029]|uniref:Polysaccharide lyase 14 domain-containing protein n=1 Tax=Exidia glandulosa HHB12029 TaxID=1314781 RepID=A0A165ZKC1_EXIGL|nr:hypothetical protein EXIGLDRAFT_625522 [Exidia glandulosa HHB12029]